jgi:hypothetical protein
MALRRIPAEELDVDQLAETELSRLQRQYRIMEGDRHSYSQKANIVLQRQRFASIMNRLFMPESEKDRSLVWTTSSHLPSTLAL